MTRARPLLVALAVLAGTAACTSADGDDDSTASTTTESSSPSTTGDTAGDELGGSRYLVVNTFDDERSNQLVLRDLPAGTEEVVVSHPDHTYTGVDVDAAGTVAWREERDGDGRVVVRRRGGEPVVVEDVRAACPRFLADGRLLVLLDDGDASEVAVADPATGAVDEVLPVGIGTPSCPAPAGPDHVVFPRPLGAEPYGPEGAVVVRMRLDGSDEEVVGSVAGGCWPLDVSADVAGEQLAAGVVCEDARLTGLYRGTMADDLRLVHGENDDPDPAQALVATHPAWSGDGTVLAFDRTDQSGPRPATSLWLLTPTDDEVQVLEDDGALAAFSPPEDGDGRD